MESEPPDEVHNDAEQRRKTRNFPNLILNNVTTNQPILVVQSPKTPTLSRKLKAVSLDSEPQTNETDSEYKTTLSSLSINRDVFSMPNTPKRQIKPAKLLTIEFNNETIEKQQQQQARCFPVSNLKKFASNSSISGSQTTLKTLPEVMTLQDFSLDEKQLVIEPLLARPKPKGLLERRGSTASLTIDLGGSNSNISEHKMLRLNTAKSVSNLNLTSFGTFNENGGPCTCWNSTKKLTERRKSQETCNNCVIYESIPTKHDICLKKCQISKSKRCVCSLRCRRKSLSNENLYVPPCGFCLNLTTSNASGKCEGTSKNCRGRRKAHYPRQPDIEVDQLLSEDFKSHLQNMQYLQTAGSSLTIDELRAVCEDHRVPKLHQEFWEVPLNLQEKCYVSGSQNKNRYRGVLPNEHSRVHLPGVQNYIHANYIKGPDYTDTAYIATQGPMAHTCHDFWNMIWHTNCRVIVMLTGLVEKGKNKCELYFPLGKNGNNDKFRTIATPSRTKFTFDGMDSEDEIVEYSALDEVTFGNIRVRFIREETSLKDCPVRYLELIRSNEKRTIRHYWFMNWQDHKMADPRIVLDVALSVLEITNFKNPFDQSNSHSTNNVVLARFDNTDPFDVVPGLKRSKSIFKNKINKVEERRRSTELVKVPLVVHCSAGIGRTGCFLAILNGIQQLKLSKTVDVLAILCSLRLNRGGMVQTAEQYELIHRVLSLYTEFLMSGDDDDEVNH